MVLATQMREIHEGGAAPELSVDGVIEVAVRGPLSAAGERAGLVDQLPHPSEALWDVLRRLIDVENGARHRIGEDSVDRVRSRRQRAGGLGIDRALTRNRGGYFGVPEEREHRDEHPDQNGDRPAGADSSKQASKNVGTQLEHGADFAKHCREPE